MIEKAQDILKKQRLMLGGLIGGIVVLLGCLYLTMGEDYSYAASSLPKTAIALPGDKVNPQEMWMSQVETQNKAFEAKGALLEQKLNYLQELLLDQKKREQETDKEKADLKKEIQRLKTEFKAVSEKADNQIALNQELMQASPVFRQEEPAEPRVQASKPPAPFLPFSAQSDPFAQNPLFQPQFGESVVEEVRRAPLVEIVMQGPEMRKRKTDSVDARIFAGTTVKALLVSSVDAVCGVFSDSDPVPVKLRILDDGHLPKHLTAKLKGGLIIGSAYGNLSNERVYIRLERMSLFNPRGEGLEMEVAGYVSGEDGRFGVRGIVIDKSAKMVKNAAYAGVLSSTGQVLQSAVSKSPVDCWNTYSVGVDILKQGAASGAGNAFDMLADYYIKRAEQVQPVVQVNAGRIVDITFTYGNSLGDVHVKEEIKQTRLRNQQRCL